MTRRLSNTSASSRTSGSTTLPKSLIDDGLPLTRSEVSPLLSLSECQAPVRDGEEAELENVGVRRRHQPQVGIHESGETVTVPPNITLASCICCGMTYDVKMGSFYVGIISMCIDIIIITGYVTFSLPLACIIGPFVHACAAVLVVFSIRSGEYAPLRAIYLLKLYASLIVLAAFTATLNCISIWFQLVIYRAREAFIRDYWKYERSR